MVQPHYQLTAYLYKNLRLLMKQGNKEPAWCHFSNVIILKRKGKEYLLQVESPHPVGTEIGRTYDSGATQQLPQEIRDTLVAWVDSIASGSGLADDELQQFRSIIDPWYKSTVLT